MKKILFTIAIFLVLSSCQDELKKEFADPETHNPEIEQVIPGMFSSMIYQWKFYVKDYGEWYWQLSGNGIPNYCQIAHRYITSRYTWYVDYNDLQYGNGFDDSSIQNWFNDYYVRLRNWALIRDELEKLSGQQLANTQLYFELATIVKDWGALRNVDLFNSIPYFDAFKGTQGVFFVGYDDPKEIYKDILDELKEVAEKLPAEYNAMSQSAKELFVAQDIALKGDVNEWVKYANFLRLKYAIRISGVEPDFAKNHIADVLTKSLPTTDQLWEIPEKNQLPGGGVWWRGLYERAYVSFIPNVIMKRMNFGELVYEENTDDPRLPVIALPTKFGDFRGVSMNCDSQDAAYAAGDRYYPYADDLASSLEQNSKSMYSFVTYTFNQFPAYMSSISETDLLLAEVALKNLGSTGKTAGDHIQDAVTHSIDFWYAINALNTSYASDHPELHPAKPASGVISAYAAKIKDSFNAASSTEDKMEILMQQKYIHINLIEPYDLWADLRRTRHPKLEPFIFKGVTMKPTPERIRYPSTELQNNSENYLKVKDQDNFTTPIFWVPDSKKSETYYGDSTL